MFSIIGILIVFGAVVGGYLKAKAWLKPTLLKVSRFHDC